MADNNKYADLIKHLESVGWAQVPPNGEIVCMDQGSAMAAEAITDLPADNERLRQVNAELKRELIRGVELCERGHGHEWANEARAALSRAKGEK